MKDVSEKLTRGRELRIDTKGLTVRERGSDYKLRKGMRGKRYKGFNSKGRRIGL